jgi:hypothetical protein
MNAEMLAEELAGFQARALTAAAASRFGSDVLLLLAESLMIGADQFAALCASYRAAAIEETAQALRDQAPAFAGFVARNPISMER